MSSTPTGVAQMSTVEARAHTRTGPEGRTSLEGGTCPADVAAGGATAGVDLTSGCGLQGLCTLDLATARLLVSVARALYPHDRLPDVHYERVVAALDTKAGEDAELRTLLTEGVGRLAATTGCRPSELGSLPAGEQVAALTRLEETPFVQVVASEVVVHLYSQHDVWPYLDDDA